VIGPFWDLLATAALAASAIMLAAWLLARFLNNASIVDIAWTLGFIPLVGIYAFNGGGSTTRAGLLAVMVIAWSLRLGIHVLRRVAKHHPEEDGRYAELRRAFPKHTWFMFFGFFQLQAVLPVVLSIPFLVASINPTPGIGPFEIAGLIVWMIALTGEAVADAQLDTFRSRPENRGKTCRAGLWRLSRHPNYFFEWLVWVAFATFALGSPGGWLGLTAPAIMLYFLFKVTGIPATEAQALKSRGDDYRDYQRTTSVFVPWFPGQS